MTVMSGFRPEVEIWPYRAMKNMQYNLYIMANQLNFYRNSSVIVDLAMGQIPRSTQHNNCNASICISRYFYTLQLCVYALQVQVENALRARVYVMT